MRLITRAQWGARPPEYKVPGTLSAESTCHWNGPTVTVRGETTWDHSRCAGLVRGIQNFHMDSKDWSDIAYNFVICPHGYAFEGRGLDIVNGANGTNAGNRSSHAIMVLAGERNPFPNTEKVGFRECVNYVASRTSAPPNKCKGHRDHKSTECPGDARYIWVTNDMPLVNPPKPTPPKPTPTPIPEDDEMDTCFIVTNSSGHHWFFEENRRTLIAGPDRDNFTNAKYRDLGTVSDGTFNALAEGREVHQ